MAAGTPAPEFKLDFVGGWSAARYAEAQVRLDEYEKKYPYCMPNGSLREMKTEFYQLRVALDRLGLAGDLMKLFTIGVRKRRMLAVVGPAEVEMLGLAGTPAQYRLVYASALEEYEFGSPECGQPGLCAEDLKARLLGVQLYQEMVAAPRSKRARLDVLRAPARPGPLLRLKGGEAAHGLDLARLSDASEAAASEAASEATDAATPTYAVCGCVVAV